MPLVYIPLEAIISKWYGEAEQKLAGVLAAAEALPSGCILFLDELDSLATQRGGDMHEATRRLLGVLLRHLDGFDAGKKTSERCGAAAGAPGLHRRRDTCPHTRPPPPPPPAAPCAAVVIGATNRKQDLDPALVSRFSASIAFGLPDPACRLAILRQYARHLGDAALLAVAEATPGLSGRDIRDLAECAERRWASKVSRRRVGVWCVCRGGRGGGRGAEGGTAAAAWLQIVRGSVPQGELPPVGEYLDCARRRLRQVAGR